MHEGLDLFILGTAFCGSTLLGNALNAHPEFTFLGELNRLPSFCQFEGPLSREGQYVTRCAVCGTRPEYDCPVWTRALVAELEALRPGDALEPFRRAGRGRVLVEGSKNPSWLRRVVADRGTAAGVRVVHCVRSPFAFCLSYGRRTGSPAWMGAAVWRDTVYDVIRTCAHHGGIPVLTVGYESLAADPGGTLGRVCEFVGRAFDRRMLQFWEEPVHPLGGNYGAYVRYPGYHAPGVPGEWRDSPPRYEGKPFGGWADRRWLTELRREEVTEVLYNPGLADAAGLAGYSLARELEEFFSAAP